MTAAKGAVHSASRVTNTLDLLFAVTALLTGLAAGFFFAYASNVTLALASLPGPVYVEVMQLINETVRNAAFATVFFGPVVAMVVGIVMLALRRELSTRYGLLFVAGSILYILGTVAVTATVHVPTNQYIATWSTAQPPVDWAATRARWARWNLVRTIAALAAFLSLFAASVVRAQSCVDPFRKG